jgi:hypothetical protein
MAENAERGSARLIIFGSCHDCGGAEFAQATHKYIMHGWATSDHHAVLLVKQTLWRRRSVIATALFTAGPCGRRWISTELPCNARIRCQSFHALVLRRY